jgi:hypothetical protein
MKIKKNGKIVNLTESDLQRIVKRTLNESAGDDFDMTVSYTDAKGNEIKFRNFTDINKAMSDGKINKSQLKELFSDKLPAGWSQFVDAFCK